MLMRTVAGEARDIGKIVLPFASIPTAVTNILRNGQENSQLANQLKTVWFDIINVYTFSRHCLDILPR